jgi:hypothetical protein
MDWGAVVKPGGGSLIKAMDFLDKQVGYVCEYEREGLRADRRLREESISFPARAARPRDPAATTSASD